MTTADTNREKERKKECWKHTNPKRKVTQKNMGCMKQRAFEKSFKVVLTLQALLTSYLFFLVYMNSEYIQMNATLNISIS